MNKSNWESVPIFTKDGATVCLEHIDLVFLFLGHKIKTEIFKSWVDGKYYILNKDIK